MLYVIYQLQRKAGVDGQPTVFLFADNQIKDESFMEDISMILNTGDVPNLYAADEKAEIIEKMQKAAKDQVIYINKGVNGMYLKCCFFFSKTN